MKRTGWALAVVILLATNSAEAGLFRKKAKKNEDVPGGHPKLVAPNGVVVPDWAARRMAQAPGPLFGKSWGRRPWAMPTQEASSFNSSAYWAALDQQGFGAGPVPGYTNGPAIGNVPSAPIGPGNGPPFVRPIFTPTPLFPSFPYAITGN